VPEGLQVAAVQTQFKNVPKKRERKKRKKKKRVSCSSSSSTPSLAAEGEGGGGEMRPRRLKLSYCIPRRSRMSQPVVCGWVCVCAILVERKSSISGSAVVRSQVLRALLGERERESAALDHHHTNNDYAIKVRRCMRLFDGGACVRYTCTGQSSSRRRRKIISGSGRDVRGEGSCTRVPYRRVHLHM